MSNTPQLPQLFNASNPTSFGVEWLAESGTRMQLVNLRGTVSLIYGAKNGEQGRSTMSVVDPDRFGLTTPPKTFAEFRAIAENYITA